ncbi:MAG: hypothetical protein ABL961_04130 [Vicinamibacterales bacterium]
MSVGVPDPKREPVYFQTSDAVAIREATRAVSGVTLTRGRLVFGGHPAISPLVLAVAESLQATDRLEVFQSEFFRAQAPPEAVAFRGVRWTEAVDGDPVSSLQLMRNRMIDSGPFSAAVFLGGMKGVEDEFDLFRRLRPGVPVFPVASTGGAAARILDRYQHELNLTVVIARELRQTMVYGDLFERILKA